MIPLLDDFRGERDPGSVVVPATERTRALRAIVESERVRKGLDTGSPKSRHTAEEIVSELTGEPT